MRQLRKITFVLALAFALHSCRMFSSLLHDEKVVARVGTDVLYESDVAPLIPEGTSPEDSVRLVMQFADTWAVDMISLGIAESKLPKGEKDVTKELEAYRRSLLKYRYEQLYINERLDTAVTDTEIEEYYEAHSEEFRLRFPIVRARFMRVYQDSPDIAVLKKKMSSMSDDEVGEADSLAYSSAISFTTYSDNWIDLKALAEDMGMDFTALSSVRPGSFVQTADRNGKLNIAYVSEMMGEGAIPPVEYCRGIIVDRILNMRKHRLVTDLERELLENARSKGKFVIY